MFTPQQYKKPNRHGHGRLDVAMPMKRPEKLLRGDDNNKALI
jgi:hypothetical protein